MSAMDEGAPVLARSPQPRPTPSRIVGAAVSAGFAYSILTTGGLSRCSDGDAGALAGTDRTAGAPMCMSVSFHPQGYVFLLLAIIALGAMVRLGRESDDVVARRTALQATFLLLGVAIAIALTQFPGFYFLLFTGWHGGPVPRLWFDVVTTITPE